MLLKRLDRSTVSRRFCLIPHFRRMPFHQGVKNRSCYRKTHSLRFSLPDFLTPSGDMYPKNHGYDFMESYLLERNRKTSDKTDYFCSEISLFSNFPANERKRKQSSDYGYGYPRNS